MADERISTRPVRDEATGLETMCALLHAAGEADSNVIKDFAWRTFNLIGAYRQERAERDRLAEQVKRVREVAAYLRGKEKELRERYDKETDDARATALLSAAALTGDDAHRIERALDGTEAGQ